MKNNIPSLKGKGFARSAGFDPFRQFKKSVSLFTALLFMVTTIAGDNVLLAQSVYSGPHGDVGRLTGDLHTFHVPSELGTLKEYRLSTAGENAPFIVHIQDAHANPDAQNNIKKMLDWLEARAAEKGSRLFVGLEGAFDTIHPEYLELYPNYPKANQKVVDDLLAKGELGGVELYAWEKRRSGNHGDFTIAGIEDPAVYRENLKAYRTLLFRQEEAESLLKPVNANLEIAKSRILSPELRQFIRERDRRKMGDYDNGVSSPQLASYLNYLSSEVERELQVNLNDRFEQLRFPNYVRILKLSSLENELNHEQVKKENDALFSVLGKNAKSAEEKALVEALRDAAPGMPVRHLAEGLWAFAGSKGINLRDYPEYLKMLGAQVLRSEIDSVELFEEIDLLEQRLIDHWVTNEEETRLLEILSDVQLIERLLSLKWTTDDYTDFYAREARVRESLLGSSLYDLVHSKGSNGLTELTSENKHALSRFVGLGLEFYRTARQRDEILFSNTIKKMKAGDTAVLLSGGFHTDGLRRLMREKNVGYAVIQPMIRNNDGGALYRSVLRDEHADMSAYGTNALNKQEAIYFRSLIETATPSLWDDYNIAHSEMGSLVAESVNRHPVLSRRLNASASNGERRSDVEFQMVARADKDEKLAISMQAVNVVPVTESPENHAAAYVPVSGALISPEAVASAAGAFTLGLEPAGLRVRVSASPLASGAALETAGTNRSDLRAPTWVDENTPALNDYTVVTRQFEAGLNPDIINALEERFGSDIANFVSQLNFTGGLGALMPDLIDSWKKNGADVIAIHPLYNDKVKGIVTGLPANVVSGEAKLGDYLKEILTKSAGSFTINLNLGDDFRRDARGRAKAVVDRELTVDVYETTTTFGKTPSYYMDIYYMNDKNERVSIFDEVYPDSDETGTTLWRDVQMGAYAQASELLVQKLQEQKKAKKNLLFVGNEVFASMLTPNLPNAIHHHINHTVFRPGLYRPHAASYEMLGFPEWMRPYIVQDGKINVTDAVALSADLITGVGLYEHTPVLANDGIFSGHLHKLTGYNENDIRSTNGVLLDQWQSAEKRQLIQQYKARIGMPAHSNDRDFFRALKETRHYEEFKRASEYINAMYVAEFLVWLADDQGNGLWLENARKAIEEATGKDVADVREAIKLYSAAVRQSLNATNWEVVERDFGAIANTLISDPIVSNVRRQVPYKGPEKWIEMLEALKASPALLQDFKKNGARAVIGGRIFDQGAYDKFSRIKELVKELGLEDRIATVENYSIKVAPVIFRAMSGVVMLSDEFLEASATSMMKGMTNFAAPIGVWGGAMPELFTIIETESGREINIFEENVTHDQLVQNLQSGEWIINNGFLVQYSNTEMSTQMGGGRRPVAESLRVALLNLGHTYKETDSRRELQQNVLASSYKVDIERSQARAHAYLWEAAIENRRKSEKLFENFEVPSSVAEQLLTPAANDQGFGWTRRPSIDRAETVSVQESAPGLLGFIDGYRNLRVKGLEALWSLSYHATNDTLAPEGDIFHYIQTMLLRSDDPAITRVKDEIARLAKESLQATTLNQRVEYNLLAFEVMDQLAQNLAGAMLRDYLVSGQSDSGVLANAGVREHLTRYLDRTAARLQSTSDGIYVYAVPFGEETLPVAVNVSEFVLHREQDAKAWATVYGRKGFESLLGESAVKNLAAAYDVEDAVTGEKFKRYRVSDFLSSGLPIGVPANTSVQILRFVQPKEDKVIAYLGNAVREEFVSGEQVPERVLVNLIRELRQNPEDLRDVFNAVANLPAEEARRLFSRKDGDAAGVPAVMALIAALTPDLLRYTRNWNREVYDHLDAIVSAPGLRDIFNKGEIRFHKTNRDNAIVISRVLGGRHIVFPIYPGTKPYNQTTGKVPLRITGLTSLDVDAAASYTVYDHYTGEEYTDNLTGESLLANGWNIAVPTQNGLHFQVIELTPKRSDLRRPDVVLEEQLSGILGSKVDSYGTEIKPEDVQAIQQQFRAEHTELVKKARVYSNYELTLTYKPSGTSTETVVDETAETFEIDGLALPEATKEVEVTREKPEIKFDVERANRSDLRLPLGTAFKVWWKYGEQSSAVKVRIAQYLQRLKNDGIPTEQVKRVALPLILRSSATAPQFLALLDKFTGVFDDFIQRVRAKNAFDVWLKVDKAGENSILKLLELKVFSDQNYEIEFSDTYTELEGEWYHDTGYIDPSSYTGDVVTGSAPGRSPFNSANDHYVESEVEKPAYFRVVGRSDLRTPVEGVLFYPEHKIEGINKSKLRTPEEVRELLARAAADGVDLEIEANLRGVDGPGSSLDLPEFQRKLTKVGAAAVTDIPSTPTIASEFTVKIKFSAAKNPNAIEYVAPDYGITADNPDVVVDGVTLTADGKTPRGQLDGPAYIFTNLFGVKGVRIELESISPMALAGGMESSNAFNVALFAAASMLSGANWSYADIFAAAVAVENNEFGGLTGGQGHLSSILGGLFQHVWLSGAKNEAGDLVSEYGAFSREFLGEEYIPFLEERMALVQAGKDYENGKAIVSRAAELTNTMWTDLLRDGDPVGVALHSSKLELAARYVEALKNRDMATVVEIVNRYVDIRDELQRRWFELALLANDDPAKPEYAKAYTERFSSDKTIQQYYQAFGDDIVNKSLYTDSLDPASPNDSTRIIKEARKYGIAIMPLGAGGPGANMIAIAQNAGDLEKFFQAYGLPVLQEDAARKIIRGEVKGKQTLRGYIPFKIGREPIRVNGFDAIDLDAPAQPSEHTYYQTGAQNLNPDAVEVRYDFEDIAKAVNLDELNDAQRDAIRGLYDIEQGHLFNRWVAGSDIDAKRGFLNQIIELNGSYPGGLAAYYNNIRALLRDSKEGKNPFDGATLSEPSSTELPLLDDQFVDLQKQGLKAANRTAFVMVAGGLGERLGYEGIKIEIPVSLITGQSYAEWYSRNIAALQSRSNKLNNEKREIPFAIMTSDDTDGKTTDLFVAQNNFGLDPNQLPRVKQGAVPAVANNDAKFVVDPENPYRLLTKPHGHGDVHLLIHQAGLAKKWKQDGVRRVVFIQDTNGQVFNAVLANLAVSENNNLAMNFATVPRDPGEAAGAVAVVSSAAGQYVGNVEYNFIKALGGENLTLPANLNVYDLDIDDYLRVLEATDGNIAEFVNPKFANDERTRFKSPARSEVMMQDISKEFPADRVSATNYPKRDVFSAVKNDIEAAATKRDGMATGESDFYKYFRKLLAAAGISINVDGPERVIHGVKIDDGAKVVLDPSFAVTVDDVKRKFKSGVINYASTLVIEGEDIEINDLVLNGALKIQAVPGAKIIIKDVRVLNKGIVFEDLTEEELSDPAVPAALRVRGYRAVENGSLTIIADQPGEYVLENLDIQGSQTFAVRNGQLIRSDLREPVQGVLFYPEHKIEGIDKSKLRTPEEVRALLQEAADQGVDLEIEANLRGVDGPGSSLDLPEFQRKLTKVGAAAVTDIPSTPTIASEFTVKIKFSAAKNPNAIEYVAPDYGITADNPDVVVDGVTLTADGKTPRGQLDGPAYIFTNLFGVKGVRIELQSISPMALAGGMESSNAFNVALFAAASMLSGANWSYADIFAAAVAVENNEFGGLTGGQGHLSSILGGLFQHVWLSGAKNEAGDLVSEYGAFSREFLGEEYIPFLEERMALVQAGKDYENGKAIVSRAAELTNTMWTDLLRDGDPVGVALHSSKLELAARYVEALKNRDMATVVEIVNRYVDIRDELQRRWFELALLANDDPAKPEYAKAYTERFSSDKTIQQYYQAFGDDIVNKSLYTDSLDPTSPNDSTRIIKEARKYDIAIMPLGAGGPGANMIAIAQNAGDLEKFFQAYGLPVLQEDAARKIIRGEVKGKQTLRGYIPFKIGREPIRVNGFDAIDLEAPAQPVDFSYDQSDAVNINGKEARVQANERFAKSIRSLEIATDGDQANLLLRGRIRDAVRIQLNISDVERLPIFTLSDTLAGRLVDPVKTVLPEQLRQNIARLERLRQQPSVSNQVLITALSVSTMPTEEFWAILKDLARVDENTGELANPGFIDLLRRKVEEGVSYKRSDIRSPEDLAKAFALADISSEDSEGRDFILELRTAFQRTTPTEREALSRFSLSNRLAASGLSDYADGELVRDAQIRLNMLQRITERFEEDMPDNYNRAVYLSITDTSNPVFFHVVLRDLLRFEEGELVNPDFAQLLFEKYEDLSRSDLRDAAENVDQVAPTVNAVVPNVPLAGIQDDLFAGAPGSGFGTPDVQGRVRQNLPSYLTQLDDDEIDNVTREVAREVTFSIFEKADSLARRLGVTKEAALALLANELTQNSVANAAQFAKALAALENAFGAEFASRILETSTLARNLVHQVSSADAVDESQLSVLAFTAIARPNDVVNIYLDKAAIAEGVTPDILRKKLGAEVTRLGGNIDVVMPRFVFQEGDYATDAELRRAMIKATLGTDAHKEHIAVAANKRFLEGFGIIPKLGRVYREFGFGDATLLMPFVTLDQRVVDMMTALESRVGFNRSNLLNRLAQFAESLRRLESAA